MGRAKGSDKTHGTGAAGSSGRRGQSPLELRLGELARQVNPLHTRFTIAGAGKATQLEQDSAKAKAIRTLPTSTQLQLIEAAQEATAIIEEASSTVACPDCGADAGSSCVRGSGKERLAHPKRTTDAMRAMPRADAANVARAADINNKAREVFIYSHTGYVMQAMRKQVATFESEDSASAMQVLSQEARLGLNDAVTDYKLLIPQKDDDGNVVLGKDGKPVLVPSEANPLTYAVGKMRNRVSEAKDQGRLMALKSRAADAGAKVETVVNQIRARGDQVTLAEVCEKTGVAPEQAAELMRSLAPKSRLDAPAGEDGSDTVGSLIADDTTSVAGQVMSDIQRQIVREEVAKLTPFQRRIVEAQFSLTDGEDVEVKDLYDGVYRDPKTGELMSSESPVIALRAKQGVEVRKASQTELSKRFKAGELEFEAGTPESFELARLKLAEDLAKRGQELPEVSRDEQLRRVITAQTGVPMVSHKVLEAKDAAMFALSQRSELAGLRPRYRGDHELESSLQARMMVRRALVLMGDIDPEKADSTKAGRAAKDGSHSRGALGTLAAKRQWIDEASGRVNWARLREDVTKRKAAAARSETLESTDELADLMSEV